MMKYTIRFNYCLLVLLCVCWSQSLTHAEREPPTISGEGGGCHHNTTVVCTNSFTHEHLSVPVCGTTKFCSTGGWSENNCSGSLIITSTIIHRKYEGWDLSSLPDEAYVGITVQVSSHPSGDRDRCSGSCSVEVDSPALLGFNRSTTTCDCSRCTENDGYTAHCNISNNVQLFPYSRSGVQCEATEPVYFPLDPSKIPLFETGTATATDAPTGVPRGGGDYDYDDDEVDDVTPCCLDGIGELFLVVVGIAVGAVLVFCMILCLCLFINCQTRTSQGSFPMGYWY